MRSFLGVAVALGVVGCGDGRRTFNFEDVGEDVTDGALEDTLGEPDGPRPPPLDVRPLDTGAPVDTSAPGDTNTPVDTSTDGVPVEAGGCPLGRGDCNGNPVDGCEADLTTALRCGECTMTCVSPTPVCALRAGEGRYGCTDGCSGMAATRCASGCADLNTDPRNCGRCGMLCPTVTGTRSSCVAGACRVECLTGYADCDGVATNGCEVSTQTNLLHCGGCGMRCTAPTGMTATCTAGRCVTGCATGTADCDGNPGNGCEANTRTDLRNCGACGTACAAGPNATPVCSLGVCRVICAAGFADCNALAADGCETSVLASMTDCGACRRACTSPANGIALCSAGSCAVSCNTGFYAVGTRCDPLPAPQPVWPLSAARVTARRPTLEWRITSPVTGARVELSRDRAFTRATLTLDVTGTSTTPGEELAPGVWYWRLTPRMDRGIGTTSSAVWEFFVGPRAAGDSSLGSALDANGDGLGDLCLGGSDSPFAAHFLAGPAGLSGAPSGTLTGSGTAGFARVLAAGDVNGDGYPDLVAGSLPGTNRAVFFPGGPSGLPAVGTTLAYSVLGFGTAVAFAGDVNRDGFGDLLFGLGISSRATVHYGSRTGPLSSPSVVLSGAAGSNFGLAVAGGQDFTGDNIDDVAVGVPGLNQVLVHAGSRAGLNTVGLRLSAPPGVTDFGAVLTAAGDVNGDGIGDLAVGSPSAARVDVYLGRVGTGPATVTLAGPAGSGFGTTVALVGDANADGYSDLAVASVTPREVRVFLGSPTGPMPTTGIPLRGPPDAMDFGAALAGVLDTDGDGRDELAVGARGPTAVFLHRGGAAGPMEMASTLALPATVGTLFSVLGAWR